MEDKNIKEFINNIINDNETNEDEDEDETETIEKTKPKPKKKNIKIELDEEYNNNEINLTDTEPEILTDKPKHKQKIKTYREVKPRRPTRHERSPAQIEAFKKARELRLEKARKRNEEKQKEIEDIMTKVYETREAQKEERRINADKQREQKRLMTVLNKMTKKDVNKDLEINKKSEIPDYLRYF